MLKYNKIILSFLSFLFILQVPYSLGIYITHEANIEKSLSHIQTRLALDLPRLSLPDQTLNNVGDIESVKNYMTKFNSQLTQMGFNAKINTIKNISIAAQDENLVERTLLAPSEPIVIKVALSNLPIYEYFSLIPLLLAMLFVYLSLDHIVVWQNRGQAILVTEEEKQDPILIINLKDKVMINSETHLSIPLANKPLCFYVALTEFCTTNKEITLNQNKDLPPELTELANKYFLRLIELGHTVRKRPNFSNSLEKTLSEIRAALDEVFTDTPDIKSIYYPPKAHGEGSRSKLHHYGLASIQKQHIEIIGK